MLKKIVLQNKEERDDFYASRYIDRSNLKDAKKDIKSSLIKLILGPRRAGKSTFAFLMLKNINFGYLNFDDENLDGIDNLDEIIEVIHEVYGDVKYLFFDEIQNLPSWELFINKLKRRKYIIVLTGSNANMLSQDIATALTGRYIPYEVLPFGLEEYFLIKKYKFDKSFSLPKETGTILKEAGLFLVNGGYPEILNENIEGKNYLSTLFDATLFKDVVTRYEIRNPVKLKELAYYLINNFTSLFTYNSLRKNLNYKSVETLEKYLSYLTASYLFFTLNKFSFKYKEQNNSAKKIYIIDNGYVTSKAVRFSNDFGRLLENVVFIEFLRKKYVNNESLFYYQTKQGKEIDFITKDLLDVTGIYQVAYSIDDEQTREREISALLVAKKELKCDKLFIITWNTEEEVSLKDADVIKIIPFYKWSLIEGTIG